MKNREEVKIADGKVTVRRAYGAVTARTTDDNGRTTSQATNEQALFALFGEVVALREELLATIRTAPVVESAPQQATSEHYAWQKLRKLCGHVENSSDMSVTLSQDDATRSWCLTVGKRVFYSSSLMGVVELASEEPA